MSEQYNCLWYSLRIAYGIWRTINCFVSYLMLSMSHGKVSHREMIRPILAQCPQGLDRWTMLHGENCRAYDDKRRSGNRINMLRGNIILQNTSNQTILYAHLCKDNDIICNTTRPINASATSNATPNVILSVISCLKCAQLCLTVFFVKDKGQCKQIWILWTISTATPTSCISYKFKKSQQVYGKCRSSLILI